MIDVQFILLVVAVIAVLFFIGSYAKILREYERAVIFRLGRSSKAILNPGGQGKRLTTSSFPGRSPCGRRYAPTAGRPGRWTPRRRAGRRPCGRRGTRVPRR